MFNPLRIIKRIKAEITYRRAVNMANQQFATTAKRQYVIRGANRSLIIVDRKYFRVLKRKRYIRQSSNIIDLQNRCYYYTPYPSGKGEMTPESVKVKKKLCITWLTNS